MRVREQRVGCIFPSPSFSAMHTGALASEEAAGIKPASPLKVPSKYTIHTKLGINFAHFVQFVCLFVAKYIPRTACAR